MSEALDLDALREVAAKARADHESYFDNGWSSDYADDVPTLIAEVQRLTAERDRARDAAVALEQQNAEALRLAREPLTGLRGTRTVAESIRFEHALQDIVRVLGAGDD